MEKNFIQPWAPKIIWMLHTVYVTNEVQPAEEYQSVKPCEEQRNVCSKSALIYSDGSSFCVPHPQPYNASAPDQTKMLCEYIHFLNMSYIP